MIAAVVLTLFGLGFVVYSGNSESHEYLFKDLSQDDVAKISQNLRASGFEDFIVDSKGIKVKSADTVRLRIQLAEAGLPNHGVIGWEKFDEESFTRTEFEQNIQRLRAIQGELQRTIMGIEGVKSARVHIVMPKQSLFIRDEKKPTASIYVKTAPGVVLNQKQITGIQHLVSFAVEGLEKNAKLFKPAMLIMGASAYPREWDYERFRSIADANGSLLMMDMAHISGLVATGMAKNPFEHCDIVTIETSAISKLCRDKTDVK